MSKASRKGKPPLPSLEFFSLLKWIDGRRLIDTIEDYRREMFRAVLDTLREDGTPMINFALIGRGKKNNKTTDLILTAFYKLLIPESFQGNAGFILANDLDQARDDLQLAKKIVQANPILQRELKVENRRLVRKDGRGALEILPAGDSAGTHGKTGNFTGFDELHAAQNYETIEGLQPDPTRTDYCMMVVSYDTFYNQPGYPLFDFKELAKSGSDPRMYCQWYSADWCTDDRVADLDPEAKANPSLGSWPEGRGYLDQQRRRLPHFKFRRLHLNLPGAPDGSVFDADTIVSAVVKGRKALNPEDVAEMSGDSARPRLHAFVDMSGGSSDDSVLAIAFKHPTAKKIVLASIMSQTGKPPFSPRQAVKKFAAEIRRWGLSTVTGDAYAGETFRADFAENKVTYKVSDKNASDIYEAFEVLLNAGEVELLDVQKLQDQFMGLVVKGTKITHVSGEHDDWANAAAGALIQAKTKTGMIISQEFLRKSRIPRMSRAQF